MKALLGSMFFIFIFCSCATSEAKMDLVKKRAEFDLGCSNLIQISEIGNSTYGASGCGKRASYVVECYGNANIDGCKAIMNSDTHSK